MDNVIDLTGDDSFHVPGRCPNAISSDGLDGNDPCLLTDTAEVGAVALENGSTSPGTPKSRTWRLPSLEEDHMQEVLDLLLLPQPKAKTSPSTPRRHKGDGWRKPATSPSVPRSRKSLKSKPNITQIPNVSFKKPPTIQIASDVEASSPSPFAATGSITTRVKRARHSFKFLQLPPEMRNRVYNLLLTTSEPIEMTRTRQTTAKREGSLSFLCNPVSISHSSSNPRLVSAADFSEDILRTPSLCLHEEMLTPISYRRFRKMQNL